MSSHPKQIIIGSSTEQLLNMVTELLKDSSFIIEKPSYPPIKQVLDKKNRDYIQATVEKNGINTNQVIHSNNDLLYITPSHQFPTGYVMNLKKEPNLLSGPIKKKNAILLKTTMIQNLDIMANLSLPYKV